MPTPGKDASHGAMTLAKSRGERVGSRVLTTGSRSVDLRNAPAWEQGQPGFGAGAYLASARAHYAQWKAGSRRVMRPGLGMRIGVNGWEVAMLQDKNVNVCV